DHLRGQAKPEYEEDIVEQSKNGNGGGDEDDIDDELYSDAKDIVIQAGKASTSYLQRKLRIGYARAARLVDMLEERGVVGAGSGAKAREVIGAPARLNDDSRSGGEVDEDNVEETML
ncbi:MAG: DNA translocase FtsK, partial [bacterium]|nr:DNA translocase FtsK [bacterium]